MSCGATRWHYSRDYATRHFSDGKGTYVTLHEDTDGEFFFVFDEEGNKTTGWLNPDYGETIPEEIAKRGLKEHGSAKEAREAADQEGRGGDEEAVTEADEDLYSGGDTEELVEEEAVEERVLVGV